MFALRRPKQQRAIATLFFTRAEARPDLRPRLALAGEEATVIEMSWYGDMPVAAPLGGAFHSRRLRLISSQVGQIAPSHRPRWTHARRLAAALAMLDDARLDALLAPAVAFDDLPKTAAVFSIRRAALCASSLPIMRRLPVFAVEVRDHIMIAHSFRGDVFGPAQALHGATFVIDAAFIAETLDGNGIVVDIGRAHERAQGRAGAAQLSQSRRPAGVQRRQHDHGISHQAYFRSSGRGGARRRARPRGRELKAIRVTLSESHVARAWYEARFVVRRFAFAVPGDLATPTGGYAYDRRMIAELGNLGWEIDIIDLGEGFPFPSDTTRKAAHERLLADSRGPRRGRRRAGSWCLAGIGAQRCRSLCSRSCTIPSPSNPGSARQQAEASARQRTSGTIRGTACCGHQRRNGAAVVFPLRRSRGAHYRRAARLRSCAVRRRAASGQ